MRTGVLGVLMGSLCVNCATEIAPEDVAMPAHDAAPDVGTIEVDGSDASAPGDVTRDAGPILPTAPRLIRPRTTATVTSHRPTLQWQPLAGSAGSRLEVCAERACEHIVAMLESNDGEARVPSALSPGVYFWRVRVLDAQGNTGATSAVWQFYVGDRDGPADTAMGLRPDLDGDGIDDWLVPVQLDPMLAQQRGVLPLEYSVARIRGTRSGPDVMHPEPLPAQGENVQVQFSSRYVSGFLRPDFDGDGIVDLSLDWGMSDGSGDLVPGTVFTRTLYGGPTLRADAPPLTLAPPCAGSPTLVATSDIADVNNDGYLDVVSLHRLTGACDAMVFLGSPAGLVPHPELLSDVDQNALTAVDGVTAQIDVNGDRYFDVLISAGAEETTRNRLYFGGPNGPAAHPDVYITCDHCTATPTYSDLGADDIDGDGYVDVLVEFVGGSTGPHLEVRRGGPDGLQPAYVQTLPQSATGTSTFGQFLGDLDGDGASDLGWMEWSDNLYQGVELVRGYFAPTPVRSQALTDLAGQLGIRNAGLLMLGNLGDLDGNGYPEIGLTIGLSALGPGDTAPVSNQWLVYANSGGALSDHAVWTLPYVLTGDGT